MSHSDLYIIIRDYLLHYYPARKNLDFTRVVLFACQSGYFGRSGLRFASKNGASHCMPDEVAGLQMPFYDVINFMCENDFIILTSNGYRALDNVIFIRKLDKEAFLASEKIKMMH